MFGMGLGMDMGMGMGMDMGMGMGMDMGMMMGMEMGMDMGMGMGMGGMGMGGMGYGQQEIIINNGYGGGTTIIENGGGFYGPREEIIINNNGYGGGYGNNNMVIVENPGRFGAREQIIINGGGYGGNATFCSPGCRNQCCYRACAPGCQNSCCAKQVVYVTQPQPKIVSQPQNVNQYPQNQQYNQVNRQNQQNIQNNVVSQPYTNNLASNQPTQIKNQPMQPVNQPMQPVNQPMQAVNQVPQSAQIPSDTTNKAMVNPSSNYINKNQYNPYGDFNDVPQKSQVPQFLVRHDMYQLQYGSWNGPKPICLTKTVFDKYSFAVIKKIKCRTNYQPFSNSLHHGQIVMKIVSNTNQDIYYAAGPNIIEQYFNKIVFLKFRMNNIPDNVAFTGEISGTIMKKSDVLGNWDLRHVKISKEDGLKSYKNPSHHHTIHIKSTKQLWTWFEVIQGKFIVIKLKHNSTKMQFGIPVANCQSWFPAFFSLLEHYN